MGLIHIFYNIGFKCNGYTRNLEFGIKELTNESYIILLVETQEHDIDSRVGQMQCTLLDIGEKTEIKKRTKGGGMFD